METVRKRRGDLRKDLLMAVGRWWFHAGVAAVLLYAVRPEAWQRPLVRWAHAGFLLGLLVETVLVCARVPVVKSRAHFVLVKTLSLLQVGVAVSATGGAHSPLVLLYPLVLLGGVADGPGARESVLAGGVGCATFIAASWSQLWTGEAGSGGALLAVFFLMLCFFVSSVLLARLIGEKNMRLERSNQALEKFASGLKSTNEKLERLSFTDGVTGVYNYRFFRIKLAEDFSRAKRYRLPLALMMVDVDGFKQYNDSHGHPVGDRVLQAVASALKENVRERDTVCRYGGDEFAVILNDARAETAVTIGERVREAVGGCAANVGAPSGVTVSLGVAVYPENGDAPEELVRLADEALYRVKLSQRNAVQVYSSVAEDLRDELGGVESPSLLNTLQTLITVINARDRYTYGHSERVVRYCQAIGEWLGLSADDLRLLRYAAFLHDIGKIEIGRDILNKPGALSEEERAIIRRHTLYGVQIIEPIQSLEQVVGIVLHHHERYDGQGYPAGLAGESVPRLARILAVADAFDAMRSHRPYREALSLEAALEEVRRGRGTQFDPEAADALLAVASGRPEALDAEGREEELVAEDHCH